MSSPLPRSCAAAALSAFFALAAPCGAEQHPPTGSADLAVEASARACLLIEASAYADRYRAEVARLRAHTLEAARWMTRPEVERAGKKHNAPYTHRRYLVAAALGETGVLCRDDALLRRSWD